MSVLVYLVMIFFLNPNNTAYCIITRFAVTIWNSAAGLAICGISPWRMGDMAFLQQQTPDVEAPVTATGALVSKCSEITLFAMNKEHKARVQLGE